MQKTSSNPWKLATIILTAALGVMTFKDTLATARADNQPKMQAAQNLLEGAKKQLEAADNDKGGHRVKAIQATNEALEQVKKGIAFDNKN